MPDFISLVDIKTNGYLALRGTIAARIADRRRGRFDWAANSDDMKTAGLRALRVWHRVVYGDRISRRQALNFPRNYWRLT